MTTARVTSWLALAFGLAVAVYEAAGDRWWTAAAVGIIALCHLSILIRRSRP